MFDVYCPKCAKRRLIFTGQIRGITNDARGIHVEFECWCGVTAVWTTGRRAAGIDGAAQAPALAQAS